MPDFAYHSPGEAPVPLHAGSVLPDAMIDRITGVARYSDKTIPFVRPGDTHDGFPILRWKRDKTGNAGTWIIEDTVTDVERMILRIDGERFRQSTGCKDGEEQRAGDLFMAYVGMKRNRMLGKLMPTQVEVASILLEYLKHIDSGAHDLDPDTVRHYRNHISAMSDFFEGTRVGQITDQMSYDYIDWRTAQKIKKPNAKDRAQSSKPTKPDKFVSFKQATIELATLRTAARWYSRRVQLNFEIRIFVPKAPKPQVTWLTRDEMARYLWAIRGRIWSPEAGRWRIARDDDPFLVGKEGEKRVLRPERAIHGRRMLARMFLVGAYQGTRVMSILKTSYEDEQTAHVDWVRGAFNRRGLNERESRKRRPSVLMVPKINRFVRNWARRDIKEGITHMIHGIQGEPVKTAFQRRRMLILDSDAGVGKHVTMHVLRHTLAMWMRNEGVSLWSAANFLGCSTKVLEERYGTWDIESQVEVVNALTKAKKQKAATKLLKKDGLIAA